MVAGPIAFDTSGVNSSSSLKEALEAAAMRVENSLINDCNYTKLMNCLRMGSGEMPVVSGQNNHDYPGYTDLNVNFQSLSQLSLIKRIPIPNVLFEQYRLIKSDCDMGLFPEIGRAWLTLDSNVFLWSFHDGSDLAYFDGAKDPIVCVGLAKPKKDVFQDCIRYILCLTTPYEIFLLGVSFSQKREDSSPCEEMHMFPEPLFSYPTDNVIMTAFASTENGRIFLGGEDGCLYEFTYQAESSWFAKKKCRKINHSNSTLSYVVPTFIQNVFSETDGIAQLVVDKSRNILYARTQKGSIQVFDLGADGQQMSKISSLHYSTIRSLIVNNTNAIDKKYFSSVIHINPVEASESDNIHLVAVLQSGIRLYLSTSFGAPGSRPNTLVLVHIRLPPGFNNSSTNDRPNAVHLSYYHKGFSLLVAAMFEDHDVIYNINNDSFIFHQHFIEIHTSLQVDGFIRALCEIPTYFGPKLDRTREKFESLEEPPLLLTQHAEPPRKFVFLSNQGCYIFMKPRPVDLLAKLLLENRGPECDAVKEFFTLHTEAQACAMCLILCCNVNPQDKQIVEYATRAFFLYGGSPTKYQQQQPLIGSPNVNIAHTQIADVQQQQTPTRPAVYASTPAQDKNLSLKFPQSGFSILSPVKSVFTAPQHSLHSQSHVSEQPFSTPSEVLPHVATHSSQHQALGGQMQTPLSVKTSGLEACFSAKHEGLYLYYARIVKPLWSQKIVYEKILAKDSQGIEKKMLFSTISSEELSFYLAQVGALKDFLSEHLSYFGSNKKANFSTVYTTRFLNGQTHDLSHNKTQISNEAAEIQERNSVSNLQQLVNFTYEFLGLWKVLCDHQFDTIAEFLNEDVLHSVRTNSFKEFFIDGRELCTNLVSAVINFYLDDKASTYAISQKLREVCPSIYRIEDATISEVFEIVLRAKSIINKAEKAKELQEALKLCKKVCPNFDLRIICNLFREVRYYEGIIDICLCTAQQLDPQNLALHYYINGEPSTDTQGQQAYNYRLNCYKTVIDILDDLIGLGTPSVLTIATRNEETRKPALTIDEAKIDSETIFHLILRTDDEIFHSALYDWLFDHGKIDVLLTVSSHFLESYLKRRTTVHSDSLQSLDLLWKFYEKNQNFGAAAKVLSLLADKNDPNLQLPHRLEYLSRAIICIKSSEVRLGTRGEGEFLHELEEKMEVARIQLHVLETLQQRNYPGLQENINRLNSNFIDITQLFEDFAVRYDLPECKLAILHCAGHYDPSLIDSLWQDIITRELQLSCGNLPENRMSALKEKLLSLSQIYMNSEKYFPVGFIIKCLETKTCTLQFDSSWVYQTMLKIGMNIMDVWSVYHKLYRAKDNCWLVLKKPLHLLQVLSLMIGQFANSPSILPPTERRSFITLCLDAIAGYLVDLQAMSLVDETVTVMKTFKAIQPRLERLLL